MGFRLTVRTGPAVERHEAASLDRALALLEERARDLARDTRRAPVAMLGRTFEPTQQVAHRLELSGGVRCGVDVRGDGSVQAWTGRWRRRLVEPQESETPYAALRRALGA